MATDERVEVEGGKKEKSSCVIWFFFLQIIMIIAAAAAPIQIRKCKMRKLAERFGLSLSLSLARSIVEPI